MNYQQVLALIQQFIVANGNNEITANVLRPILEAILAQPNELIGDLGDLQTNDQTDLVSAINEVMEAVLPPIGSINTKIHPLSLFGIDPDLPELTKIAEAVKLHGPFTCDAGQQMVFRTISTVGTQENGSIVTRYYRLLRNVTTIGGTIIQQQVLPSWFMPDGVSEYANPDAAGTIIELGDIGTSEVWDVFNLGNNGEAWDMNEYRFVRARQNGDIQLWAFVGTERYYGGPDMGVEPDIFEAFESDFFLITDQPEEPDPFDPSDYDLDEFQNASIDPFVRESEIPAQVDLSTGLEAINEGNGVGWRLKGRNPNNYGNIGQGAIDLGASNSASTTVGATGTESTVGGGYQNEASGYRSTVGGGDRNKASGYQSTVGGGNQNEASGAQSTVGGGDRNKASGTQSNVGGGSNNEASGARSAVGGGKYNEATGDESNVGGGVDNKASGAQSTVGGGSNNEASGIVSAVIGGIQNLAKSLGEVLGGIYATIKEGNASTWIGTDRIFGVGNGQSDTQRSDAFNIYKNGVAELPSVTNALIDAAGAKTIPTKEWVQEQGIDLSTGLEAIDEGNGIGWRLKGRNPDNYGNIGKGAIDLGASNSASTTVGATGERSTVGGGFENESSGTQSTVGGGYQNTASDLNSTVGGGNNNVASGRNSTVGGGIQNIASGIYSTVGGGIQNEASAIGSTVGGGIQNIAKTFGEFLGGLWSTIKEGNASTWIGTDRIFGVGNGQSDTQRSDAFNVYKNGVAELPSVTNALIDAADGKAITTKEWVNSRNSIILVITPLGEVLETGDVEYTFTAPYDLILTNYWVSAQVAPIGSGITVRLKVNGTYIDSTGTTIPTGIYNSLTSLPIITTPTVVKGDRITAEITAVGSTYEGEGLTLYLES